MLADGPWQQNIWHFGVSLILFQKCAKFYLILTSNAWTTFDLNIEYVEVLLVTSQFLLMGHKMLNFLFAFFLKISETLKAHIFGTKTDINKRQKAFISVFNGLSY